MCFFVKEQQYRFPLQVEILILVFAFHSFHVANPFPLERFTMETAYILYLIDH